MTHTIPPGGNCEAPRRISQRIILAIHARSNRKLRIASERLFEFSGKLLFHRSFCILVCRMLRAGFHKAVVLHTIIGFAHSRRRAAHPRVHTPVEPSHHHLLLTTDGTSLITICLFADHSNEKDETHNNKKPGYEYEEFAKRFLPGFGKQ